ncbi:MAG: hypothetical protein R3E95_23870 [Thiolinea sp.]
MSLWLLASAVVPAAASPENDVVLQLSPFPDVHCDGQPDTTSTLAWKRLTCRSHRAAAWFTA